MCSSDLRLCGRVEANIGALAIRLSAGISIRGCDDSNKLVRLLDVLASPPPSSGCSSDANQAELTGNTNPPAGRECRTAPTREVADSFQEVSALTLALTAGVGKPEAVKASRTTPKVRQKRAKSAPKVQVSGAGKVQSHQRAGLGAGVSAGVKEAAERAPNT